MRFPCLRSSLAVRFLSGLAFINVLVLHQAAADRKRILFFAGPASHGWGAHQHPAGSVILSESLKKSRLDVDVELTNEWPDIERLREADAFVIYADGWSSHPATNHVEDLKSYMDEGGGLTVLHWATGIGGDDIWTKRNQHEDPIRVQWRNLVGADFEPWHSVSRIWDASFKELADHEVTRGVPPFTVWDECYFHLRCMDPEHDHVTPMHGALPPVSIIQPGARADSGSQSAIDSVGKRKEDQYCAWGFERPNGGRAFGYTGGHLHWNWARDEVRKLILNGVYWTSGAVVPDKGVETPRPTAAQMLANLKKNPGWSEENLQIALDVAASGKTVHWTTYDRGTLPNLKAKTLFDGETLQGWQGDEAWWRVEDGMMVGEIPDGQQLKQNQFLFWEGELHDFELRLKYRIEGHPSANSGVQFRSQRVGEGGAAGYQADIDDGSVWTGRIYDEHGRALIVERGAKVAIAQGGKIVSTSFRAPEDYKEIAKKGEWNDYVIRAEGPRIQTWINGELASDLTDDHLGQHDYSGLLALQLHSGQGPATIAFKEIVLTELGRTEQPKVLENPNGIREGVVPEGKNLGFEDGTLKGWKATGDAWKGSPIKGDTVTPRRPGQASNHDGHFWVGSYELTHSDTGQGVLESLPFKVTHPWASFLVGAGSSDKTRVDLVDAETNAVFFTAAGQNRENMSVIEVDLQQLLGRQIMVRVVDESSGPWGHINYDDFRFHEAKPNPKPSRVDTNPLLNHLTPNPVDDEAHATVAGMWVTEGFQVDLIATEPTVTQPIAFTFDERGRLWIVEAHSYPQRQPEGQGKDRVIILEDTEGDGSFETRSLFADGLNLVSGIEVGFGGVWIGAAPQLLFLPDKDADDKVDGDPVVLLDGFGFQDTHETINSFTWGPDGWLYGNQGVFNHSWVGRPGTAEDERIEMRAGVWRYHPTRHTFEVFATGCSNQWGIDFNEVGHLFITHCRSAWGGGPTSYMVQGGHYWNQANSHHAPFIAAGKVAWNPTKEPIFRNFLPSSAGYGHGEGGAGKPGSRALYGGHSHVGTMIYLGGNWPAEYRDQLFTHNLHGHQMNRQINVRLGAGYETRHAGTDQLFIEDPQFIGVDLKYGPDGAVYMIDWVDKQHCHTNNVGSWDRSNGRIYRMQWKESYKPVRVDLRTRTTTELVDLVTSQDEWYSRTARRLLQERSDMTAVALLEEELASSSGVPETLRLLWARHLVSGNPSLATAFTHDAEEVRSWAVTLSGEGDVLPVSLFHDLAETDSSSMVRLSLASTLPRLSDTDRWKLAETLGRTEEDGKDIYLPKLIWYGLAPIALQDPERALALAKSTPMPMLSDSIMWYLSKDAKGRDLLSAHLATPQASASHILMLMNQALSSATILPAPKGWAAISRKLRNAETSATLDGLGGIFGDVTVLASMRRTVADAGAPMAKRAEALQFLKASGDTECMKELVSIVDTPKFRSTVLPLLGRFNDRTVAEVILTRLPNLKGADRNHAVVALASQPVLAQALMTAIKEDRIDRQILTSLHVRQMQNLRHKGVDRLLADVWGRVGETSASAREQIAKYRKLYDEAPLWAHAKSDGQAVYTRLCATCHVMNGAGLSLGPDLTGSWANGIDYFLENIVDPNAVVGESFQLNFVTKKDGTVVSGMPEAETEDVLTIRTVTESVAMSKSAIQSRQVMEESMMPAALLDALPENEVIDLLKFLTSR
jgi:putative membrane-bound dehydrogenase-like protein